MTSKFPAAKFPAVAHRGVAGCFRRRRRWPRLTPANAEPKRHYDNRGRPYYGPNGPNVVYQQGPHTRIYVTKRSWLDAGVEVLPGDRKFTDYAFPPESVPVVRAREQQSPDRPPAAEPAVGHGRISAEFPAILSQRPTISRRPDERRDPYAVAVSFRKCCSTAFARHTNICGYWSRLKAGTSMRKDLCLRVQRLHFLQDRLAHLRRADTPSCPRT